MLYFSSKLRDFESTGLVLYPQNAGETDFTANGQIKFDLPSNTLVDLDSLHIDAKCFCDDAAASTVNRLPADIHKLIRRVEVTAGGQELGHAYNFYDRLKHGVDALTGKEPGPTSHPRLLRTGLDSAEGPTAFTAKALAKKAAIAAAEAAIPTLYSSTVDHLPLKAPLDGGAAGVTPADGSVNIIGRHSATKLSVCGYSADGTKVMTETTFTWLQLAAALDVDGAQLVPLFEVLGFANYSTTQAMVDAIAAAQQAVLDTRSSRTVDNEGEAETNDVRFTFDSFGGFLQTVQPRMLDLSILPTISITLHLNTPECLVTAAGDADPEDFLSDLNADEVASGFTVRDPRLYITAIGFSNSSYDSYVSAALSKRAIELPFRNYTHFHDAQFTDSISFQTSSRSVDKIHFQLSNQSDRDNLKEQAQVVVSKGWREMYVPLNESLVFLEPITIMYSGAEMVDSRCTGEKYAARRYLCSHTGQSRPDVATDPNATFQLSINGMLRPTFPADATWWYKESALALSEERDPWNGGALFAEWTQDVSHKVLRLNRRGSTVQTASGIDTRNSMLYCQLNCPSTLGASAVPARMDVWIESTSLLRVVAARDIELVA